VSGLERPKNIMREKIDMSLNRSLGELCDSYWEFQSSDELKTEEEESEFGALQDCLEGMGFVSHLM
jgi:hypothetical protein